MKAITLISSIFFFVNIFFFETFVLLSHNKWVLQCTTFDVFIVMSVKVRPPSSYWISVDYCPQLPFVTSATIFVEFYIDIINANNKPVGPASTKPLQFKSNNSTFIAQNFLGSHNIKIFMPSAFSWPKNSCFTAYGLCLHILYLTQSDWIDIYTNDMTQIKETHF